MGIWIRSQDKGTLADIVSIYMDDDNNICGYDECSNNADNYYKIGKYSSKEKAINVLDMIQEHISEKPRFIMPNGISKWLLYDKEIFEMPHDDEV